ncbi:Predicted arabinose efflux permease, MFS family [Amycolatopsis arida]|uniref:Predicted arabinose efflux permease, MFS family n=1 Tax=Amycolatopsis arida TaxID=587909 RepID=A0A1I5XNL6_9PSEU|nr:MFS transporter [Amycolatopsis arida]TDX97343.1 putative MFS family arabinose efflux permease [Amycolatopsis arida]SFQ33524.1 Predicted arabinose efflux permease, MFS family [Amycolatopsis arida]
MPRVSLWLHRDFRRLWAGDTVSQFGTFVGHTVLPLLAATVLAATPAQMGLLTAAEHAAFLLLGLPAGVWVDRVRRRTLMLAADAVRGTLLLTVPLAWWAGALTLTHLVVVALLVGACTLFFDVSYQSYLPFLVGRDRLVEGNTKLQASQSVAQVTGPGIGGLLVQAVGAATAVTATGLSYLASAGWLLRIRAREPRPVRAEGTRLRTEVAEGLRFVFGDRALRAITGYTASANFAGAAFTAVEVLFLTRHLGLPAAAVGTVLAAGGAGSVLGALTAGWWTRRIGQARAIWLVPLLTAPAMFLVPLSAPGWRIGLVVAGLVVTGYGIVVYNVAQISYRQALCPDHLLGRMNASIRCVVWGTLPLGALAGGLLGEWIGVPATVWVAAAASTVAVAWVLCSPLRTMRDVPTTPARVVPSGS